MTSAFGAPAADAPAARTDHKLAAALLPALVLFLAYLATAAAGLGWATVAGAASPVWPAAGVGVAGLAIAGRRYWPAIILGLLAATQLTGASHGLVSQIAMGLGNALAAVVGALVLCRFTDNGLWGLTRLREVIGLLVAGSAAAAVSALVGVVALVSDGALPAHAAARVFQTWLFGDAVGVFIFGGLILAWHKVRAERWQPFNVAHLIVTLIVVASLSWYVFFGEAEARTFLVLPALIWAAFLLSTPGATASLAVLAAVSIAGTTLGHGPFTLGTDSGAANLVLLQQYLAISALMALLLASVAEERRAEALQRTGAAEALAASRLAELTSLYESAPIGLAFFSRDYRYLRINEELAAANGVPVEQHIGRTIREVLDDKAPPVEPIIDRIFATGEPVRDLEVSGETPLQPGVTRHWLTGFYPIFDDDGAVKAVGAWVIEISERKAAQERETLLAREVDHRAKNLLAVVQSIVQLTPGDDGTELKTSVVGRIQALARAHSLLSDARWDGVVLGELVAEELAPFSSHRSGQVTFDGPAITLRPAAAQSLALVLHELATNAAKYGALSDERGRLDVQWRRDREDGKSFVEILWTESNGPAVQKPEQMGFGSNIIRTSVERQLRGRVTKEWRAEGLICRLYVPSVEVATASDG
jgi:two-component sensor histidine kinase/integral membrane sensor domain MASE1